jgi:hypothetical protein
MFAPSHTHSNQRTGTTTERKGIFLADNRSQKPVAQLKANNTGLPDHLKSGIENLSGISMDDVKVNYNSAQPAQLNAHAYAQGNRIHLAPGQEKHLPHEAWHVVQQKQGRVKPTAQLKGRVNVNDNEALETEATAMGAKAQTAGTAEVRQYMRRSIAHSAGVVQRVKSKPVVRLTPSEHSLSLILDYAAKVEPSLDDDADRAILAEFKARAKRLAASIAKLEGKKAKAPWSSRRPVRGPLKPVVSKLTANSKEDFQELIDRRFRNLRMIAVDIRSEFPIHSGGFGAKGRAHKMDDVEVEHAGVEEDRQTDNTFISGITINEVNLTDEHQVVKPQLTVGESVGPLIVENQYHDPASDVPDGLLAQVDGTMAALSANSWSPVYQGTPRGMDRGLGQYANMANTNANGYAWLWQVPGWATQRWEWLHVRGAGLGGATDGTNLVLGTRDANTQMIPFESNIRVLAAAVPTSPDYAALRVDWSVAGAHGHKVQSIHIDWELVPRDGKKPRAISGRAGFNPLHTGSNISKAEVTLLEKALKDARAGVGG